MCLIGNLELLCMQCRGIGSHFLPKGKSHGFSRVAAGTWGIFRVTEAIAIQNSCLFSDVKTPV